MDHEITRQELKLKIDRREPFVLEDAHLPGAVNLPPDQVAELAPRLLPGKEAEIVVYCSGPG